MEEVQPASGLGSKRKEALLSFLHLLRESSEGALWNLSPTLT